MNVTFWACILGKLGRTPETKKKYNCKIFNFLFV